MFDLLWNLHEKPHPVGCIGVVYSRPWVSQWQHALVEEKQKVKEKQKAEEKTEENNYLVSCPDKLLGCKDVALKKNDLEIIQATLDEDHKIFVEAVKASRGEKLEQGTDLFTGIYWNAEKAEKLGLIDGIDNVESYIWRRWSDGVDVRRWYHSAPWKN